MLLLESFSSLSTTKLTRTLKPYKTAILGVSLFIFILICWLHVEALKDELIANLEARTGTLDDVDLDSDSYDDNDKKGADVVIRRGPKKDKDAWRKAGGFAPIKKLKLATEEPEVEIPPFFPQVEENCKMFLKRVAGAWITHLKDPGDAQHRHRTDSWNLCFDEKRTRMSAFRPRGTGTNCVVYSFGLDMNWSFEEDMLLHNCEVHMFDGSQDYNSLNIRRKIKNLSLHRTTLSNYDRESPDGVTPDLKTLGTIMSELNHDRVDVIKVDIEGSELLALEQASSALVNKVDQLLLEVHMHLSDHAHDSAHPEHFEQETVVKWTKLFTALRNDGFRVFDIRAKGTDRDGNIIPRHHYSCCYRIAFIKTPYRMKPKSEDEVELKLQSAGDEVMVV